LALKLISPGVFTRETDLTGLAAGVTAIGAVLIGPTPKGPANVPVTVSTFSEFEQVFGGLDPDFQLAYAAQNYLKNSAVLTVVRTLGHDDGLTTKSGFYQVGVTAISDAAVSGSVLAVVHHTGTFSISAVPLSTTDFAFTVSNGATVYSAATASFVSSSSKYVEKVLNTDPAKFSTYGHYVYRLMKYTTPLASASWTTSSIWNGTKSWERNFSGGSTPWVTSQPFGGSPFNLFKFHTLAHGDATTSDIKVMIANVKPSAAPLATEYGTFDVVVRRFSDTDQRVEALETFPGCTLDPTAPNFIARVIGDSYLEFDTTARKVVQLGEHNPVSKHVRVELNTAADAPKEALPWGHLGYSKESWTGSHVVDDLPYQPDQFDRAGNLDLNIAFGVSFVSGGISDRMRALPNSAAGFQGAAEVAVDTAFSLSHLTSSYLNGRQVWKYNASVPVSQYHEPVFASSSYYKFNLPFQGGFDGLDPRNVNALSPLNASGDEDIGVVSLKRSADVISDPDFIDVNVLALPGVHNLSVTDHVRSIARERGDCLYVMDVTGSTVPEVVSGLKARNVDDNYTACYYPDLKVDDKVNSRIVRVSPSAVVVGAIAYSDRVGQVFFAPAGHNRGGLRQFNVTAPVDRLTMSDRNSLYENRINPIASFPNEGTVVYGQKTLQVKSSALDRINVRRLLIFAKKTVASAARLLLFEPNDPALWQSFTSAVNPIFERVRQERGIERFKVVMDGSTNTPDLVARNITTGAIFLQPTRASEFIDLNFVVSSDGVQFDEA